MSGAAAVVRGPRPPAAVHVDCDGARDVFAAHGWRWGSPRDPLFESGLAGALDFLDGEGLRATFFVVSRDLDDPAKRTMLAEIARRGHEVASHSATHRLATGLSRAEKRREVTESRERLEAELATPVGGFRAPGFAVDRETLELVGAAGYAWDSSLFPGRASARRAGLERVPAAPHRLEGLGTDSGGAQGGSGLVELPLPRHAPLPLPFHPSYSLVLGGAWFRLGLARADRAAPLVLLFHLTDFADPLPPSVLPGLRARLFTLSHLSRTQKRERCRRMLARVKGAWRPADTDALLETVV